MRRTHHPTGGFTFVETLIAGGILVVLASMATLWATGGINLWWTTNTQTDIRMTAQQAIARMASELQNGTRIATAVPSPNIVIPPAPNNTSVTFYLPTDIDGNGLIVDATGNIEWDMLNPIQYVYDPGTRRILRLGGGQTVVMAHDVQSVQIDDQSTDASLSLNEARLSVVFQTTTPQQRTVSATSTSVLKLRN